MARGLGRSVKHPDNLRLALGAGDVLVVYHGELLVDDLDVCYVVLEGGRVEEKVSGRPEKVLKSIEKT